MLHYLLSRFNEASTWRGIVLLLTVFGVKLNPDESEAVIALGLAVAGCIAVFLPNRLFSTRTRKTDYPPSTDTHPPVPDVDLVSVRRRAPPVSPVDSHGTALDPGDDLERPEIRRFDPDSRAIGAGGDGTFNDR